MLIEIAGSMRANESQYRFCVIRQLIAKPVNGLCEIGIEFASRPGWRFSDGNDWLDQNSRH